MYFLKSIILSILILLSYNTNNPWSKKLEGKVNKMIFNTFETEDYLIKTIPFRSEWEDATDRTFKEHFYSVYNSNELLGYIFVDQAASMKNKFDYAVIFSPEFEIIKTKVLIYREQHGRQIGTQRWLKQFLGLTPRSRPQLGENIDGISGATISTTSITRAIHDLLKDIDYLQGLEAFSND